MAFIPMDKMKILREAAAKGDENAKRIIDEHFQRKDFSSDLDAYFAPKPEQAQAPASMSATETGKMPENVSTGNPKLDEFLRGNGIKATDPDYKDALEDYYREFPNERPETEQGEETKVEMGQEQEPVSMDVSEESEMIKDVAKSIIDTIGKCDHTSLVIMQNEDIDATVRKGAMSTIQEVKQSLLDAAEKLAKVKESLSKKEKEPEEMMGM